MSGLEQHVVDGIGMAVLCLVVVVVALVTGWWGDRRR